MNCFQRHVLLIINGSMHCFIMPVFVNRLTKSVDWPISVNRLITEAHIISSGILYQSVFGIVSCASSSSYTSYRSRTVHMSYFCLSQQNKHGTKGSHDLWLLSNVARSLCLKKPGQMRPQYYLQRHVKMSTKLCSLLLMVLRKPKKSRPMTFNLQNTSLPLHYIPCEIL